MDVCEKGKGCIEKIGERCEGNGKGFGQGGSPKSCINRDL